MAALSQKDQLAFHEFSVRYRAGLAKKHAAAQQKGLDAFKGAVREQYEQEQQASHDSGIEPPSAGSEHKIEDPDEGR
jgi:hypothetical protein